jgi:hypothetical protein
MKSIDIEIKGEISKAQIEELIKNLNDSLSDGGDIIIKISWFQRLMNWLFD